MPRFAFGMLVGIMLACSLAGCVSTSSPQPASSSAADEKAPIMEASDQAAPSFASSPDAASASASSADSSDEAAEPDEQAKPEDEGVLEGGGEVQGEPRGASFAGLDLTEDYRSSFVHGYKGPEHQKYIVMHDTEGDGSAESVIAYWDSSGAGVAAHFIVNRDGSVVQCVPLDAITHHAGFGDAGHNALYGVEDESRDDMVGTVPIGDWAPDYGMNSYSVGIEMVHVGGSGWYPEEQLAAVDALIAYIDAYYGFECPIIDHKAWRSGNSDTSPEFAQYLANLQDHRSCY